MYVRWLGNSCLEVIGKRNILIDPNYKVKPESVPDILLITHEHDDHFAPESREKYPGAKLYAPATTIHDYSLHGNEVSGGETLEKGIQVMKCDCYNSKDAVAYYLNGLLHTADASHYPEPDGEIKLLFTACYKDLYSYYIESCQKLNPKIVVPYHYNPESETEREEAEGLIEKINKKGIYARPMEIGEKILI